MTVWNIRKHLNEGTYIEAYAGPWLSLDIALAF